MEEEKIIYDGQEVIKGFKVEEGVRASSNRYPQRFSESTGRWNRQCIRHLCYMASQFR